MKRCPLMDDTNQAPDLPSPPVRPVLNPKDRHTVLRDRVQSALLALPGYFTFESPISGINAADLFNLNTLLGAGIEVEVVRTLNRLREIWDPDDEWLGYRFERSNQAFPDVRLVRRDMGKPDIALGIELKGWFLFAKEGVPSLRYQVTPAACSSHDMVCVVPWHLSNAVAGEARVVEPWIESARYAAEWRDYWWEHIREAKDASHSRAIHHPPNASPYPTKAEHVLAVPDYDGGNNYGRLPRCRPLMDDFLERTRLHEVLGIPVDAWFSFLKLNSDTASAEDIIAQLQRQLKRRDRKIAPDKADRLLAKLDELVELL